MEDILMEGCCPIEDYPFEDEGEMEEEGEELIGKIFYLNNFWVNKLFALIQNTNNAY